MKYKYIIITVVIFAIVSVAGYAAISQKRIEDSKQQFAANLEQIAVEANALESIPLQSIYRNGKGWFHINAGDANFEEGKFYTKEGYLGNGNSATLQEFLRSTGLSESQAQTLASFMKKYPNIEGITPDPNISGTCIESGTDTAPSCRAVKFYMPSSVFRGGVSTEGFMYIPFGISDNATAYLDNHFSKVTPVSGHWYQFSGEH